MDNESDDVIEVLRKIRVWVMNCVAMESYWQLFRHLDSGLEFRVQGST